MIFPSPLRCVSYNMIFGLCAQNFFSRMNRSWPLSTRPASSATLKLFAGSMALTGLLLIGWSAAYVYISMERFWEGDTKKSTN